MSSVDQPSSKATTGLVLGVVGVIAALTLASIGAVIGGVGVVFALLARREGAGGMAIAGLVLGVLAAVIGVVSTILTVNGTWPG